MACLAAAPCPEAAYPFQEALQSQEVEVERNPSVIAAPHLAVEILASVADQIQEAAYLLGRHTQLVMAVALLADQREVEVMAWW